MTVNERVRPAGVCPDCQEPLRINDQGQVVHDFTGRPLCAYRGWL